MNLRDAIRLGQFKELANLGKQIPDKPQNPETTHTADRRQELAKSVMLNTSSRTSAEVLSPKMDSLGGRLDKLASSVDKLDKSISKLVNDRVSPALGVSQPRRAINTAGNINSSSGYATTTPAISNAVEPSVNFAGGTTSRASQMAGNLVRSGASAIGTGVKNLASAGLSKVGSAIGNTGIGQKLGGVLSSSKGVLSSVGGALSKAGGAVKSAAAGSGQTISERNEMANGDYKSAVINNLSQMTTSLDKIARANQSGGFMDTLLSGFTQTITDGLATLASALGAGAVASKLKGKNNKKNKKKNTKSRNRKSKSRGRRGKYAGLAALGLGALALSGDDEEYDNDEEEYDNDEEDSTPNTRLEEEENKYYDNQDGSPVIDAGVQAAGVGQIALEAGALGAGKTASVAASKGATKVASAASTAAKTAGSAARGLGAGAAVFTAGMTKEAIKDRIAMGDMTGAFWEGVPLGAFVNMYRDAMGYSDEEADKLSPEERADWIASLNRMNDAEEAMADLHIAGDVSDHDVLEYANSLPSSSGGSRKQAGISDEDWKKLNKLKASLQDESGNWKSREAIEQYYKAQKDAIPWYVFEETTKLQETRDLEAWDKSIKDAESKNSAPVKSPEASVSQIGLGENTSDNSTKDTVNQSSEVPVSQIPEASESKSSEASVSQIGLGGNSSDKIVESINDLRRDENRNFQISKEADAERLKKQTEEYSEVAEGANEGFVKRIIDFFTETFPEILKSALGLAPGSSSGGGGTSAPGGGQTGSGGANFSGASAGSGNIQSYAGLGDIMAKYETGGKGTGSISNTAGDSGGASYGKAQLAYNTGSLKEFVNYLGQKDPQMAQQLQANWGSASQGKDGAFGQAWMQLSNNEDFKKYESEFIGNKFMSGPMQNLPPDLQKRIQANPALQEAFLSTTINHGPSGGASAFKLAFQRAGNGSDEDLIKAIYEERANRASKNDKNSDKVKQSLYRRYQNEANDILALNKNSQGGMGQSPMMAGGGNFTGGTGGGGMSGGGYSASAPSGGGTINYQGNGQVPASASVGGPVGRYISIARRNAQGASYSQSNRMGANSFDCSSFVSRSLKEAGFNVNPGNTTQTMIGDLSKAGFKWHPRPVRKISPDAGIVPGDILLKPGKHTEIYTGGNRLVGAHSTNSGVSERPTTWGVDYSGFLRLDGMGGGETDQDNGMGDDYGGEGSAVGFGSSPMADSGFTPEAGGSGGLGGSGGGGTINYQGNGQVPASAPIGGGYADSSGAGNFSGSASAPSGGFSAPISDGSIPRITQISDLSLMALATQLMR